MRACLLATRLARVQGLREPEAAVVYATTLLRFVGCTATSLEYAKAFGGDDVAVRGRGDQVDPTVPAEALGLLWGLGDGSSPLARLRLMAHALPRAKRVTAEGVRADCEVAASMARPSGWTRRSRRRCGRSSSAGTAVGGHTASAASSSRWRHASRRSPMRR
jgi:hypothetical protein